jgi:hypothetical protein
MRLPSAKTQFLAFLVPFVGISLTFTGTTVAAARRAGNSQNSRTRVTRTLRANVGHEWDVLHEEPDKRWEYHDPDPAYRAQLLNGLQAIVPQASALQPPVEAPELLAPIVTAHPHFRKPATHRGRAPPQVS